MKTLILTFLVLFGLNSAVVARPACRGLFENEHSIAIKPALTVTKSTSFEDRFANFQALRDRIETLKSKKKITSQIVKIKAPELNGDVLKQIEFLRESIQDSKYDYPFIKNMMQIHIGNLESNLKKGFTLEQHYRLSLKTAILLGQKIENPEGKNARFFAFNKLQETRLEKFIQDKISDEEFIKSFKEVKEFLVEWENSVATKQSRVLVFSTLDMGLPKFNHFLSPDISFLGLINHKANPDSLGEMGSLRYAAHDLDHHRLYTEQFKEWKRLSITPDQKRQLMIDVRKRYLEVRKTLKTSEQMSLDIFFFTSFHEDTNIFPRFIKIAERNNGKYQENSKLDENNVLDYGAIHGLQLTSKFIYYNEAKASSMSTLLNQSARPETLYKAVYPTWKIMNDIWLDAYNSLNNSRDYK